MYRYNVTEDGTITRASIENVGHSDSWSFYWDGDGMVGFYEEFSRGRRTLNDSDDCERAISAYRHARIEGQDTDEALRKVAVRLTGNADARFICVGLDRGCDFYVLAWGGDPENKWRDEIEAVNEGEVYRLTEETYGAEGWRDGDDFSEDYYGEAAVTEVFEREYPLTEFPADLLVTAGD